MNSNILRYYQLLGITENASIPEIKRAYRKKAILLHPDKNKSENAHDEFVSLTEAYEYILGLKSGKYSAQVFENVNTPHTNYQETEREKARKKAREYAKMKHKEFIDSDFYKGDQALLLVMAHLFSIITIVLFFTVPVILILSYGRTGVWMSLLILLFSIRLILDAFQYIPKLNFKKFKASLRDIHYIIKPRSVLIFFASILNGHNTEK